MDLAAVMDEVSTRMDTIAGLRMYDEPPDEVQPPAGVIGYPEITFDGTYGRGMDRYEMPVYIVVGKYSTRAARAQLAPYLKGSGASSVKAVLESSAYTYTSLHTLRVTKADVGPIMVGATEYLAATFTLDITGAGT